MLTTAIRIHVEGGRLAEARALLEELRRLELWAHGSEVGDLVFVMDELDAEALVREAVAQVREEDDWTRAVGAALAGEWARAAELDEARGGLSGAALFRLHGARRLLAEGRESEAEELLERSLAFWHSVGARRYVAEGTALRERAATG
jgi:hypothetical protein